MATTKFPVLRFMTALKAARDFGIDPARASAIAIDFNPLRGGAHPRRYEQLVEALTSALIDGGAVYIPNHA